MVRLDAYARTVLSCDRSLTHAGVTIVPSAQRGLPAWHGYTLPIVALTFREGTVIAARPDMVERLRSEMGSDAQAGLLDLAALRRLHRAIKRVAEHSFTLGGEMRAADGETFQPYRGTIVAKLVDPEDPSAAHLRGRFDARVFGIRGPHGRIVAWAGLKEKSPDVWEIAVTTEADYRGRGFARATVSAATQCTLEAGRLPLYIHDRDNEPSAFVCRSLGYQSYADVALAEY